MKNIYILSVLVLVVLNTSAQVPMKKLEQKQAKESIHGAKKQPSITKVDVSNTEVEQYKKEDVEEAKRGLPPRFGIGKAVNFNLKNSGIWEDTDSGRVWRLRVESPNATSINLVIKNFYLKTGANFYIYTPDGKTLYGPVTEKQNNPSKGICTIPILGDAIVIELFEPNKGVSQSTLQITSVVHGYVPLSGLGQSYPCHNNVVCPGWESWQSQSDAVAMVILNGGTRWCSSALVNNTCQNWIPYVLTAFHCLDYMPFDGNIDANEANEVHFMTFMFQYKSPTCSPSQDPNNVLSINGANLRSAWANSDFALVELSSNPSTLLNPDPPRSCVYAGWSRSNVGPSSAVGIHHPNGDVMKISQDNNTVGTVANNFNVAGSSAVYVGNRFWNPTFDSGTIEGGSSGSPLFNPNGRIIGQLFASNQGDRCVNRDGIYGRFDVSWDGGGTAQTRLRDWLDPSNSGAVDLDFIQAPSNLPHQWAISGPNQVQCNQTTYFGSLSWPSNNYIWTVSPNLTLVNGQGGQFIGIAPNTTSGGTGIITLRIGCATAPVSATLAVTIVSCARIAATEFANQEVPLEQLIVFPNPTKQEFHVKFLSEGSISTQIELVDQSGKKAYSESLMTTDGVNDHLIRLGHPLHGLHVLKVKMNEKVLSEKVLFDL